MAEEERMEENQNKASEISEDRVMSAGAMPAGAPPRPRMEMRRKDQVPERKYSFETPPAPIPEKDISPLKCLSNDRIKEVENRFPLPRE